MSLMRLLSAGKTLMGSGEPMGRYRFDTRYRLPKFGPAKNPFLKPVEAKPSGQVEMQMAAPVQRMSEKVRMTPAELRAANMKETQRLPVMPAVVHHKTDFDPTVMLDLTLAWLKVWAKKLNPAKLIPKRKPVVATPVVQKAGQGPVQAELSLEKIRVVRNDLSDADLEIVPMKAQPKVVRSETPRAEINRMETAPELVGAGRA